MPPFDHRITKQTIGFFVVLSVVMTALFYNWAIQNPLGWIEDDGYFYAQIAYNIGYKGISSFDGIHVTDGYHLLWMGILGIISAFSAFISIHKDVLLSVFIAITLFVHVITAYRVADSLVDFLFVFALFFTGSYLMETSLLALLLIELVVLIRYYYEKQTGLLLLTLLFALIPLARIDALLFMVPLIFYLFFSGQKKLFSVAIVGSVLGMTTHFLVLYTVSGHFFTVSSLLKLSNTSFLLHLLGLFSNIRSVFRVSLLLLLLFSAFLSVRRKQDNISTSHRYMIWGALLFYGVHFLANGNMRSWYFIPGFVLLFTISGDLRRSLKVRYGRIPDFFLIGIAFFIVAAKIYVGYRYHDVANRVRLFTHSVAQYVREDEPVFQVDGSGYVGYFSKRPIVNGDGLVNSHHYAQLMRHNALAHYLRDEHICFIITNTVDYSPFVLNYHGLTVKRENVETVLSITGDVDYFASHFVLYRLKAERCHHSGVPR